jgi:hypothetical protein
MIAGDPLGIARLRKPPRQSREERGGRRSSSRSRFAGSAWLSRKGEPAERGEWTPGISSKKGRSRPLRRTPSGGDLKRGPI